MCFYLSPCVSAITMSGTYLRLAVGVTNTMAPAFEGKKNKAFIVRLTGKVTGGKAQIFLPSTGFRSRLEQFQHHIFLDK